MKLTGVETIEITDPKGLCNPPVPQSGPPLRRLLQSQPGPVRPVAPQEPDKWGVGLAPGAKKWAENWQSKMAQG